MKILAIDTTENTATAAICEDERLLAHTTICATQTHSEAMLPIVEALLQRLSLSLDDIDLFALSAGPGSFTGVRIGAATIKGLAFGRGKPIVPVSALEAMAWNHLGCECAVCPCMDARRGQVYSALFAVGTDTVSRLDGFDDNCLMGKDLIDAIANQYPNLKIRFCGGAYRSMAALCASESRLQLAYTPEPLRYENAYGVALCAYRKYLADPSVAVDELTLVPTYLRASQAERERKEREEAERG